MSLAKPRTYMVAIGPPLFGGFAARSSPSLTRGIRADLVATIRLACGTEYLGSRSERIFTRPWIERPSLGVGLIDRSNECNDSSVAPGKVREWAFPGPPAKAEGGSCTIAIPNVLLALDSTPIEAPKGLANPLQQRRLNCPVLLDVLRHPTNCGPSALDVASLGTRDQLPSGRGWVSLRQLLPWVERLPRSVGLRQRCKKGARLPMVE